MHYNKSLLLDIEVLLGIMVETSRCSTKLLDVVLNFYSSKNQFSEFLPNFWISTNFMNFYEIYEFQPKFWISNISNVSSNCLAKKRHSHIGCICRLFSTVHFQMSPQMGCPRGCIITLVAFVWLFSTVHFQMCPQIVCPRRGIVTLVTLVWLFSTVCFQMCPQIAI